MDRAAIPNHRQRSTHGLLEFAEKIHDIFSMDMVRQKPKVQIQTVGLGADRYATDCRESIASIPAFQDRSAAARSPRAAHGRRQHVPGFIEKNQVGLPLPGSLDDIRKAHVLEKGNLVLVGCFAIIAEVVPIPPQ